MRRTVLAGLATLALVGGSALVALPAQATGNTLLVSHTTVAGDGTCAPGATAPQFGSINDAVADAAPSGDTILVCAGVYDEGITTTKSITFWGAQHGQPVGTRTDPSAETIFDAQDRDYSFDLSGEDSIVDGFTIRAISGGDGTLELAGHGQQAVNDIFDRLPIAALITSSAVVLDRDRVVAPPSGGSTAGFHFQGSSSGSGTVSNTTFTGAFMRGDIFVDGEIPSVAIGSMTIKDNSADLSDGGIFATVAGTENTSIDGNNIFGTASSSGGLSFADGNESLSIHGNQFTGLSIASAISFSTGGKTISGTIVGNAFLSNSVAITITGTSSADSLTVASNIIAGNTGGILNTSGLAVDATDNFWGCNEGPTNTSACDNVTNSGSGTVTYDPWMVVSMLVDPTSIVKGSTATATADLEHNSNGALVMTDYPPDSLIANFSFTKGTVSPAHPSFVNGEASTTLTGTTVGTGPVEARVANVVLDTDVTVTQPVTPPPPTLPALTIHDGSVLEGNSGTHALTFKVTMSKKATKAVTVHFTTANGSAVGGSDFVAKSGVLTIAKGKTSGTITILVKGDKAKEPNETFYVNIFTPTNARIADPVGQGTIRNDDH